MKVINSIDNICFVVFFYFFCVFDVLGLCVVIVDVKEC